MPTETVCISLKVYCCVCVTSSLYHHEDVTCSVAGVPGNAGSCSNGGFTGWDVSHLTTLQFLPKINMCSLLLLLLYVLLAIQVLTLKGA